MKQQVWFFIGIAVGKPMASDGCKFLKRWGNARRTPKIIAMKITRELDEGNERLK